MKTLIYSLFVIWAFVVSNSAKANDLTANQLLAFVQSSSYSKLEQSGYACQLTNKDTEQSYLIYILEHSEATSSSTNKVRLIVDRQNDLKNLVDQSADLVVGITGNSVLTDSEDFHLTIADAVATGGINSDSISGYCNYQDNIIRKTARVVQTNSNIACLAYWSGFVFNSVTKTCDQLGSSGCSNPFPYTTKLSCESDNLK